MRDAVPNHQQRTENDYDYSIYTSSIPISRQSACLRATAAETGTGFSGINGGSSSSWVTGRVGPGAPAEPPACTVPARVRFEPLRTLGATLGNGSLISGWS